MEIVINWEFDISIVEHELSIALHFTDGVVVSPNSINQFFLFFSLGSEL